jgi:PAS domain-containing protein
MSSESPPVSRYTPTQSDRSRLALLSALAEAPDLVAAATFLLSDVLATTGARRALLLQFDKSGEELFLVAQIGTDETLLAEYVIAERGHPWMVSTLTLTPVVNDSRAKLQARAPFDVWTCLPMPRPHYRGAPAIWTDAYAAEVLSPIGARLAPLANRQFSSAPGGVVVVDSEVPESIMQELASTVMFAGPVLFRVAAHLDAEVGYDRVSRERNRYQQMVDSLPDPVVITDASNDIMLQNKRAEHLLFVTEDDSPGRRRAVELNNLLFSSFLSRSVIAGTPRGGARELNPRRPRRRPRPAVRSVDAPRSESVLGPRTPYCPCCETSPTCGARRVSSNARCTVFDRRNSRQATNATGST